MGDQLYEVVRDWDDASQEPERFEYTPEGLRAACDLYHVLRKEGNDPFVRLVHELDDGRDEVVVLSSEGHHGH